MVLPKLLQARRERFNIPDAAFKQVAMFDRVLLWQVEDFDTLKDAPNMTVAMPAGIGDLPAFSTTSRLVMPAQTKAKKLTEAPRGVVVTAGLEALDYLWAHGAGIGSIVKFVRMSPWHLPIGLVDSREVYLQVVRAGDIIASEDLAESLYQGVADVERVKGVHRLCVNGEVRERYQPEPSEDY